MVETISQLHRCVLDKLDRTSPRRVVVVGSSFAGLTAALELRKHLHARNEVVVLDPRESFTLIPSLVWLPSGSARPTTSRSRSHRSTRTRASAT
jgi:NADH dehydrogenase FAD-containing subunit